MLMLRKILFRAAFLFLAGLSPVYAGDFYLGPSILFQSLSVPGVGFNGISAPRITAGYEDMLTQNFYGAAEVFGTPATIKVWNGSDKDGSLRITYDYGVGILPGINFDNTIVGYGRLGYIRTRFSNMGKIKGGVQLGLGIQWVLTDVWSARLEYTHTRFHDIAPIGHADMNSFGIGVIYRFVQGCW